MDTIYESIGGEIGLKALVDRFYDDMAQDPAYRLIREMHPPDMGESNQKLFEFLSGRFGGPNLYIERRGHPRLRRRHMPFPIDSAARDQWIACMDGAIAAAALEAEVAAALTAFFAQVADFMRNRPG
jgi:hemoglobin